ncbi:YihY/virulence factor BrkB family protein [Acidisoma sp. S159]|uniref:YihY/virulence factor BrkB family protein n=2 Tax=unclassified Acidisoma TaxID=2634065 RepID=UPI0020B16D62|nr:YihY/virulence factor BrkB family protein [Acidisoma sp. S159]
MASNLTRNIGFVTGLALFGLWLDKAGGGDRQGGRWSVTADGSTGSRGVTMEPGGSRGETGRGAKVPSELPPRGWIQILKRVFSEIGEDSVLAEAASVTFYALLALFPALAALVSLYGLIADPRTLSTEVTSLSGVMPGGGMSIITDQLKSLASSPSKALGIGVIIGLLTSLWSANAGMKALFDALNVVYGEREKRSYIRRTLISLAFTLGTILFLILALAGIVVLPAVLKFVGLGGATALLLEFGRWPVLIVAISVFLALGYRYGPSRAKARWRWVSWGSVAAAILWLIVSLAFSFYVSHFGSYNKTYGSLGAVIGFMTWMWLSATVVLIGAELNAEMEHQTARDTTEGPEKPLGQRRAEMADQVAAT